MDEARREAVGVPRSGHLDVPGGRLWFDVRGAGPAVLFSHATIADHRMWDPQMAAFSATHRVVRYDMRGFGLTTNDATPWSTRADILALLDHLGVERAALVGCSAGGGVSLSFAVEHPERVAALVLVDPGVAGLDVEDSAEEAALGAEGQRLEAAGEWARAADLDVRVWVDGIGQPPDRAAPHVRELVRTMDLEHFEARHPEADHIALDPPAGQRLAEVAVPTLLLIGDLDTPASRAIVEALATGIRGSAVHHFPNAAHLPNLERPEEFNRVVLRFLAGVPA